MRVDHQSRIVGMGLLLGDLAFGALEATWRELAAEGRGEDAEALLLRLREKGFLDEATQRGLGEQVADLERLLAERPAETGEATAESAAEAASAPRDFGTVALPPPSEATPERPPFHSHTRPMTAGADLSRELLSVLTLPRWNQYLNLHFIGEGGMGRIFRAYDPTLNRAVALKFLRWVDSRGVNGLIEEARNQALVDHPNICKVYEVQEWRGQVCVVMQFLEGRTLDQAARELSTLQKVELVETAAEAVHAAHRHGLIHRDLKPANLMVTRTPDGGLKPYVLDFGLARDLGKLGQTREGTILGTAHYMAPEQAKGDVSRIDRRTDVYALGVTLYEVLVGAPPFHEFSGMDCLRHILESEIPPPRRVDPSVHPDLQTIVMKCLEKDMDARYDSARALAEDLRRFRDGEPILARPASLGYRLGKRARKHKALVALAAAALVAVLGFAAFALQARVTAASRAQWAQHFGQEAERIEALLRYARLQPVHDLRPELAAVRARIGALESELAAAGGLAQGPGTYALGRAYLALGEGGRAQAALERAWAAGFRTGDVAYARGRVLGLRYARELENARLIQDPGLRQARILDLEETLRDPALALLRQGRGSLLEPPGFQEGLVAYCDGRSAEALASVREALRSAPWFYEARALEAQLHLDRARRAQEATVSLGHLERAGQALLEAERTAPSDSGLCDLLSRRWLEEMALRRKSGQDPRVGLAPLEAACATWARLVPGDPDPEARRAWAELECAQGAKADSTSLQKSLARTEALLARFPEHPEALGARAAALRIRAYGLMDRGGDPRPDLDEATRLLQRALAVTPAGFELFEPYAATAWARVEYEKSRGQDPGPTVQAALGVLRIWAERHPKVADFEGFLGGLLGELADHQASHGTDPQPVVAQALQHLGKATRLAPGRYEFAFTEGNAHLALAQYRVLAGEPAQAALDAAEAAYRAALARNPGAIGPRFGLGEAGMLRVQALEAEGHSPVETLAQAEAAMQGWEAARQDWRFFLFQAQAALARSRWVEDPERIRALREEALRWARQALAAGGRPIPALVVMAQAERAAGREARAQALLREALQRDPGFMPALRLKGF